MPLSRTTSLESLRRLIGDRNYWNPRDPQFEDRQRQVREGFGRLYSAKNDGAEQLVPEDDKLGDDEIIHQLRRRYDEALTEYGKLLRDYPYPVPPEIQERMRFLEEEWQRAKRELEKFDGSPGIQYKMKEE